MRDRCNNDLCIEATPQRTAERSQQKAVKGEREQFEAGYATLDQAQNGEYSRKERRGLARDANYPTRY